MRCVASNNTHFLISLFENFLKDILKSAPYLFGTLINERVVTAFMAKHSYELGQVIPEDYYNEIQQKQN